MQREKSKRQTRKEEIPMRRSGTDWPVVAKKSGNPDGAKGLSYSVLLEGQLEETSGGAFE